MHEKFPVRKAHSAFRCKSGAAARVRRQRDVLSRKKRSGEVRLSGEEGTDNAKRRRRRGKTL
ncbi:hypothetical protein E2C01_004069 [Portunus trituberculatus]|uniref:Uncharacterized protein n=1 Tax=Portunus trituberculatus TaxID=210409 RepID=A0A5B7CQD5_PORTR|nr:hypothetical protein [Portunus trituberculatus]